MQLGFLKGKASVLSQSICLLTGKFNSRIPLLRQRAPISKDNVVDQPKFQRKVLYQLANLANEIKDLRIAVEMMGIPSSEHIESVEVHLEIIAGPIQTLNGYRNLEEQCGILANKTTLFQLLSRIGGTSSKGTSKNLLKRLFSNFVMSHLSMDGIGTLEKLPFRDTALCQLVVEYIMKRDCSSTVSEIHSFLGSHLRMAPFRIGGTGKSHLNAHFSSSQDGEAGLINLIKNDEDHHEDDLDLDGNNDY
ncbi:uncharacterized protein LOC136090043 isoform X1 [Hydra vulgaris]|uniref:Uncharacterized protein LOC136090043 isoform X1 n=1 Tax=Hydra vulgaris TaxID=6087 RepID=A0ABM4DCU8_HYDVU